MITPTKFTEKMIICKDIVHGDDIWIANLDALKYLV